MTEPHAGSDLKAIRTKAVRDGDDFVINGQKVFISNGQMCDVIVLATKTDTAHGAKGITLFLVDAKTPGFVRGQNLEKLGLKAQDTSELFFENLRVPASAMLGEEGHGFALMMTKLAQERLAQAIRSATVAETVIQWTVDYTAQRKAFGKTIADFQNTQFKLADMETELEAARYLLYVAAAKVTANAPDKTRFAAMAKRLATDTGSAVVDRALQLHGGYGYLMDYPIERFWRDLRVHSILEGTNQIMRLIVSRDLLRQ
jgi:alkylation response protein AidB-like acyl-CoA dehydrogenase